MNPTPEQRDALKKFLASPCSSKPARAPARQRRLGMLTATTERRGLYLAFNKAIATEAKTASHVAWNAAFTSATAAPRGAADDPLNDALVAHETHHKHQSLAMGVSEMNHGHRLRRQRQMAAKRTMESKRVARFS